MKKFLVFAALAALACVMTGCCSIRTPAKGRNHNLNYYHTFFGMSIESAIYGDGFLVNPNSNE